MYVCVSVYVCVCLCLSVCLCLPVCLCEARTQRERERERERERSVCQHVCAFSFISGAMRANFRSGSRAGRHHKTSKSNTVAGDIIAPAE